jgi:tetratricopeptide (TPR) repeat protein
MKRALPILLLLVAESQASAALEIGPSLFEATGGRTITNDPPFKGPGSVQRKLAHKLIEKRDSRVQEAEKSINGILDLAALIPTSSSTESKQQLAQVMRAQTMKPLEATKTAMLDALKFEVERLRLIRKALQAEIRGGRFEAKVELETVNLLLHMNESGERRRQVNAMIRGWRGFALGMAQYLLGDEAPAISKLTEASRVAPQFAQIHAYLGSILFLAGKRADGLRQWGRALSLLPADRVEEAENKIKALDRLIDRADETTTPERRIQLAQQLRKSSRELPKIEEPKVKLRETLRIGGVGAIIRDLSAGGAGLTKQQHAVAVRLAHVARTGTRFESSRRRIAGYRIYCEGLASYLEGDLVKSVDLLRKAARLLPELISVHKYLGSFLYLSDQPQEALLNWRRALQLNPKDKELRQAINALAAQQH